MRYALLPAGLALALLATPALAQTANQQPQPGLSSDMQKPQQNTADEAAVRGRLEDGVKPPDAGEQKAQSQKLEDAAAVAKQNSGGAASTGSATGATVPNPASKPQ